MWCWRIRRSSTTWWCVRCVPAIPGRYWDCLRLGIRSAPYRSRAVIEPRAVLKEFGLELDDSVEVRVWDSTAEVRYMILPDRPQGTGEMSEAELVDLITRDSMIGVARAKSPASVA